MFQNFLSSLGLAESTHETDCRAYAHGALRILVNYCEEPNVPPGVQANFMATMLHLSDHCDDVFMGVSWHIAHLENHLTPEGVKRIAHRTPQPKDDASGSHVIAHYPPNLIKTLEKVAFRHH